MEWYLKVVRDNYANFKGRARRKEFWMFVLFNFIISFTLGIVGYIIGTPLLSNLYSLAIFIPSIAVAVRRLHDIGKSGWWLLIAFIPIIGFIWLIVLYATEGDSGPNEYGEDPKASTIEANPELLDA